ncbi:hypothetical protein [Nonomuraea gerenzanensis]|uniref:hypothetical protein n=1 Tax=Nonomuraea gerenzanensis TaxID=93944 RepID=UPI001CD9E882|nr:hypothetical protein [Nonomuraea gerenzanensis]UBU16974.1 hypothetical protein LCN96_18720 [Nonomuraea gerenzanensis]
MSDAAPASVPGVSASRGGPLRHPASESPPSPDATVKPGDHASSATSGQPASEVLSSRQAADTSAGKPASNTGKPASNTGKRDSTAETSGSSWEDERSGRPKARILLIAAAILIAAAVGVGGWMWLGREQPRPATFHAEPTSAFYTAIDTRQNDASPLTLQEVFTGATKTLGKMSLVGTREFTDCDEALWGATAPGCTQALQAMYQGGAMAGQFVVFNLADGRAADALVAALRTDGFVRQDIAFEAAGSRAQARAMGHYVTVSWVGGTAQAPAEGLVAAEDLVTALVALDGLGRAVQGRIIAAT